MIFLKKLIEVAVEKKRCYVYSRGQSFAPFLCSLPLLPDVSAVEESEAWHGQYYLPIVSFLIQLKNLRCWSTCITLQSRTSCRTLPVEQLNSHILMAPIGVKKDWKSLKRLHRTTIGYLGGVVEGRLHYAFDLIASALSAPMHVSVLFLMLTSYACLCPKDDLWFASENILQSCVNFPGGLSRPFHCFIRCIMLRHPWSLLNTKLH